jgi:hypothetical protein
MVEGHVPAQARPRLRVAAAEHPVAVAAAVAEHPMVAVEMVVAEHRMVVVAAVEHRMAAATVDTGNR